jgi:hypothetical protein
MFWWVRYLRIAALLTRRNETLNTPTGPPTQVFLLFYPKAHASSYRTHDSCSHAEVWMKFGTTVRVQFITQINRHFCIARLERYDATTPSLRRYAW